MNTARRVTAGPYTLLLRPNSRAMLYEADRGGEDHEVSFGSSNHLDALVQFAGEVVRLQAMADQMSIDRHSHVLAVRGALSETSRTVDELCFWRYQAIFWRAYAYDSRLMSTTPIPEQEETWRTAERDLEAARVQENRERTAHADAPRDPGAT